VRRGHLDLANIDELIELALLHRVRLIVIDTLNRAMNGADENSSEAMGQVIASIDRLKAATGACVLLVHHSGKDATKGSRGHSSLQAAVDTEIEVRDNEDGTHCATVLKQRDLAKGDELAFRLESFEIGSNRRDKPVTTCLLRFDQTVPARKPARRSLSPAAQICLRALDIALGNGSAVKLADPSVWAVRVEQWRAEVYSLKASEPDTNKHTFNRGQDALLAANLITCRNPYVWKT
jgi:hypothetical protein